ncbi:nSTAND1 domain-containing NTPase [Streptomyces tauricus]|uniref:nSTAND1 domain-containing NTPase n=1 Tax=Streptomyces tauricus TaxID=68274 RepID=UPI00341DF6CA
MAQVDDGLTPGIARFRDGDGEVTGSGFLIAEGTLCTCAHVVARTLGTEETDPAPPEPSVTVDFPLLSPAASPPLVEFALAELWERQAHGRLTHAAYREIGGVEGALSRYADHQPAQVCKAPEGPDEATARRLFERLARPVKGREFIRVACGFDQLPTELRAAAQALAGTRLRDHTGRCVRLETRAGETRSPRH